MITLNNNSQVSFLKNLHHKRLILKEDSKHYWIYRI
jgi:hypothetical protein